jgi:hypothetical protein
MFPVLPKWRNWPPSSNKVASNRRLSTKEKDMKKIMLVMGLLGLAVSGCAERVAVVRPAVVVQRPAVVVTAPVVVARPVVVERPAVVVVRPAPVVVVRPAVPVVVVRPPVVRERIIVR